MQQARVAYAEGMAFERKTSRRSFRLGHAAEKLFHIINNNEVAMSSQALDAYEGLMDGDLEDVWDAFKLLGSYAQVGLENTRYVNK